MMGRRNSGICELGSLKIGGFGSLVVEHGDGGRRRRCRVEKGTRVVSGYAWNEEERAERPFLLQKCPCSFSFVLGCSINSTASLISYFII